MQSVNVGERESDWQTDLSSSFRIILLFGASSIDREREKWTRRGCFDFHSPTTTPSKGGGHGRRRDGGVPPSVRRRRRHPSVWQSHSLSLSLPTHIAAGVGFGVCNDDGVGGDGGDIVQVCFCGAAGERGGQKGGAAEALLRCCGGAVAESARTSSDSM